MASVSYTASAQRIKFLDWFKQLQARAAEQGIQILNVTYAELERLHL